MVANAKLIVILERSKGFLWPLLLIVFSGLFNRVIEIWDPLTPMLRLGFWVLIGFLASRTLLKTILSHAYVKNYRYSFDGGGVAVLSGVWNHDFQTITQNRIQKVLLSQSFLQKLESLATLTISTAGSNTIVIEHLPLDFATKERNRIVDFLNSDEIAI